MLDFFHISLYLQSWVNSRCELRADWLLGCRIVLRLQWRCWETQFWQLVLTSLGEVPSLHRSPLGDQASVPCCFTRGNPSTHRKVSPAPNNGIPAAAAALGWSLRHWPWPASACTPTCACSALALLSLRLMAIFTIKAFGVNSILVGPGLLSSGDPCCFCWCWHMDLS